MSTWTDEEVQELEHPDAWDWDAAETRPPSPLQGIRVLVRFSPADFDRVSCGAKRRGESLIDFIRSAALERAAQSGGSEDPAS